MATHSAPRRPPRYSSRASKCRRTAYHGFGLRDEGARLPDSWRDVYGEAYEEGKCDRGSAGPVGNCFGSCDPPYTDWSSEGMMFVFRTRTLIWINPGEANLRSRR